MELAWDWFCSGTRHSSDVYYIVLLGVLAHISVALSIAHNIDNIDILGGVPSVHQYIYPTPAKAACRCPCPNVDQPVRGVTTIYT